MILNKLFGKIIDHCHRKLFYKNLIIILMLLLVPTFLIGRYILEKNRNLMETEIRLMNRSELERVNTQVLSYVEQASWISIGSLIRDTNVLSVIDSSDDFIRYKNMKNSIIEYTLLYNYIYSIYINYKDNIVATSLTFDDYYYNDLKDQAEFIKELGYYQNTRIYLMKIGNYPSLITFENEQMVEGSKKTVDVNVNALKLGKLLFGEQKNEQNRTYIIDKEGSIIITNDYKMLGNSIYEDSNISMDQLQSGINFFQVTIKDKEYYVSTKKVDGLDLMTVNMTSKENYSDNIMNISTEIMKVTMAMILIIILLTYTITIRTYTPIKQIVSQLQCDELPFNKTNIGDEVKYIKESLKYTMNSNSNLKNELEQRVVSLRKAQVATLQSQINPHFLYNTLDAINWMAVDELDGPNKISNSIVCLSTLLSSSMDVINMIQTIEKEILITKSYVELMSIRYTDDFETIWEVDTSILNCKILKLCIQPLIENAIIHGIKDMDGSGRIEIFIRRECDDIQIQVKDNGVGITEEKLIELSNTLKKDDELFSDHIGIRNVNQRIKLLYGTEYGVTLESVIGTGTVCSILVPIKE